MARTPRKLSGPGKRLAAPGRGLNKWDHDQRLALRLLFIDLGLTAKHVTTVFNTLFAHHLKACGLPNGLETRAIQSQWGDRGRPSAARQWSTICLDTIEPKEVEKRKALLAQINLIATSLTVDTPMEIATRSQQTLSTGTRPPSTPTKRKSILPQIQSPKSYKDVDEPPTKRRKQIAQKAVVVITRKEQETARQNLVVSTVRTPRTPVKRSRSSSKHRPDATINYKLPSGTEIWLTLKQFRETQHDLIPLAKAVAHPYVPLLFRYSTPDCQSPLTDNGFLAGRFATTIIPPPPPPTLQQFAWSDAAQHLNRDRKIASPFISTSNNFVWIVRLAIKEQKRGATGGLISLIDPRILQQGSVFHAQPLHRELCKKRPFDNAAFMYHGMHEHLVWAKVQKSAIIATISVESLVQLANQDNGLGAVLRLEQLAQLRTGYYSKILPSFKQANIGLERESITAIAKVCKALGLAVSSVEAISSVVTDIIKGYAIMLEYKSASEWRATAAVFSEEMCKGFTDATFAQKQSTMYAFLDGSRWATGDFNARQKLKHMQTMLGRAKKIGVDNPAQILISPLDEARHSISSYNQQQRALLRRSASRALLAEPDEVEDQIITTPSRGRKRIASSPFEEETNNVEIFDHDDDEESIIYNLGSEGDNIDDEESIIYDLGSEGDNIDDELW